VTAPWAVRGLRHVSVAGLVGPDGHD